MMQDLLLLGKPTFFIPLLSSLPVVVNLAISAFIGAAMATIVTMMIASWFFNKEYKRKLKNILQQTDKFKKSIENQISSLKHQNEKLEQEINQLQEKEEDNYLQTKVENLENAILNLQTQEQQATPKITHKTPEKPIIKKNGLYDYILEGLKNTVDFYNPQTHQTFESYLRSLQKPAIDLWESYQSDRVQVNYSEPSIQAAYLIRYYPHYVEMTLKILKQCSEKLTFGEKINACFFGAGPCPEVAGLAQFLTECCPQTKELFVSAYDIASEQWKSSRVVTRKFVIPSLWNGKLSGKGITPSLDFSSANSFDTISEVIENSHLFVFQNCLNEITNISDTKNNIKFLLASAPLNSFIIIGDLLYEQNCDIVEDIASIANQKRDYQIIRRGKLEISSSFTIPQIVRQNLLTGEDGLIPRSRIKFLFLVIRKS